MIHSVTVINYLGESMELILREPEISGFLIGSISGIGPAKANINMSPLASDDGSFFGSARVEQRNIVMTVVFIDSARNGSVEMLRHKSYQFFPVKQKVTLVFKTESRVLSTQGYVESNEPTIFSQQVGTQISIICPDPYFYSYGVDGIQVTRFSGIDPLFEFPFSNESLTDDLIEFASIERKSLETVYYEGDAEIGITVHLNATGPVTNISIFNRTTNQMMKIDTAKVKTTTGKDVQDGDEIIINTTKNNKSVTLIREGTSYNILNCLDRASSWFKLVKGDNIFTFTADTGDTNLNFEIENRIAYEGV